MTNFGEFQMNEILDNKKQEGGVYVLGLLI